MARRWQDPQSASELGRLDPEAIARVRAEAWPDPVNAEELHDALLWLGCLTEAEAQAGAGLDGLAGGAGAATSASTRLEAPRTALWIPAERLAQFPRAVAAGAAWSLPMRRRRTSPERHWAPEQALVEILRGRLEGLGPVTTTALATPLGLERRRARRRAGGSGGRRARLARALFARSRMTSNGATAACSRASIIPPSGGCARKSSRSPRAISCASCSPGSMWPRTRAWKDPTRCRSRWPRWKAFEAPARAWETEILPARLSATKPSWLDAQCLAGRTAWARLTPPPGDGARSERRRCARRRLRCWIAARRRCGWRSRPRPMRRSPVRAPAPRCDCLAAQGALFFDELAEAAHLLRPEAEQALAELAALGLATFGQFCRAARAAGSLQPAPAARRRPAARPGAAVRHGKRRPLGSGPPRPLRPGRRAGENGGGRACRAHAAAALRRRVLSPARPRGFLAAAVARRVAGAAPAGGARRNSRRALRRRFFRRAICAARSGRACCARCAGSRPRINGCRCRRPTRSI